MLILIIIAYINIHIKDFYQQFNFTLQVVKFKENQFPDKSIKNAENFCRNPTGDVGGPWCYVDEENFEYVIKEYCDISFCDDKGLILYLFYYYYVQ